MEVARLISQGDCEEAMNLGKGWGKKLGGRECGRDGEKTEARWIPLICEDWGGWKNVVSRAANAAVH